jgi:hypothetical protein
MSCGHGCGHWHRPPYGGHGCSRWDWPEDADPRWIGRDRPRVRQDDPPVEVQDVQLAGLTGAIRRLEGELAELRSRGPVGRAGAAMTTESGDR